MAVLDQSGLAMIALIKPVMYVWPALTGEVGCSDTALFGMTQETAGSVPARAAAKKLFSVVMFPVWPSWWTSVNDRSGFQMPGVCGPCWTGAQLIAESDSQ